MIDGQMDNSCGLFHTDQISSSDKLIIIEKQICFTFENMISYLAPLLPFM